LYNVHGTRTVVYNSNKTETILQEKGNEPYVHLTMQMSK